MAYNKELGVRIDKTIDDLTLGDYESKKMFGGVGYMINGNMACGILGDQLIVRVGKEGYEETLHQKGVTEFLNNGRPMTGWVMVDDVVLGNAEDLRDWVMKGLDFVKTLPRK